MKTVVERIYDQYEKWRSLPTKEEHARHFLAWFVTYKEENLAKDKEASKKMYTEQDLHEIVNDAICKPGRIKQPHSNACAEFVNNWINKSRKI